MGIRYVRITSACLVNGEHHPESDEAQAFDETDAADIVHAGRGKYAEPPAPPVDKV